jgi:hypothetical protein
MGNPSIRKGEEKDWKETPSRNPPVARRPVSSSVHSATSLATHSSNCNKHTSKLKQLNNFINITKVPKFDSGASTSITCKGNILHNFQSPLTQDVILGDNSVIHTVRQGTIHGVTIVQGKSKHVEL